jgi:hypothetical protein
MDVSVEDISTVGDEAEIMKAKSFVMQRNIVAFLSRHGETVRKGE